MRNDLFSSMIPANACVMPMFWNLLSDVDKYQYMILRAGFATSSTKNQRNKRIENFSDSLAVVKQFAVRGEECDWKRCLVCGVAWLLDGGIAVNTHQLKILICKCKSSINGSLLKMGYSSVLARGQTQKSLESLFPILKSNQIDVRQWTIRQSGSAKCTNTVEAVKDIISRGFEDAVVENIQHEEELYGRGSNDMFSWGGLVEQTDAVEFGW